MTARSDAIPTTASIPETTPGIGHNRPPMPIVATPEIIAEQIAISYADVAADVTNMLARARELPKVVTDNNDRKNLSELYKKLDSLSKRIEKLRVAEKDPYLRGGDVVHHFFKDWTDRLEKTMAILHKRVDDFNQRLAAEERRRRQEEADRLAKEAREAEDRRRAEEAAAAEAAAAAARARKPENIAAHQEKAAEHQEKAEESRVDVMIATQDAQAAQHAATAKSADLVRTRFDSGVMNTMRQAPYVEIVDVSKLDKNLLWPFIKEDEILKALKAWAKTTSHKKPMAGAIVEMRDDTVIK